MRLTLRTLLAYLDDTLEPAAAKEIGQKLAETPAAQELVTRIREVTRRRRLTAPSLTRDEIDPNDLAEYLDNLLSPEGVAEVEQVCLQSDIHLAEAAACHQILTLLGQPAHVPPATRQRMHDLLQSGEVPSVGRRPIAHATPEQYAAPSAFARRPVLARTLSVAAVLTAAAVLAGLIWVSTRPTAPDDGPGKSQVAARSPAGTGHFDPTKSLKDASEPQPPKVPPSGLPEGEPAGPEAKKQPTEPDSEPTDEGRRPPAPEGQQPAPEKAPAAAPATPPREPSEKMPAARPPADSPPPEPTTTVERPETKAELPPKPESPRAEAPAVVGTYVSTSGILMHSDREHREWRRLATRSDITTRDPLLCLPTYRAMIQLPTGPSVELVGGAAGPNDTPRYQLETELVFLPPAEGTDVRLELARGRIVLGTNKEAATFQIDFLDSENRAQTWKVTLKGPESVAALLLGSPWKPGRFSDTEAVLFVPRGEAEFQSDTASHALGAPAQLRWNAADGFSEREALPTPPAWIEKEEISMLMARASEQLASDRALPVDASPTVPLIGMTTSDRKESRVLAVQCLGAIGGLRALIDAMRTVDRRDVRVEAIKALRLYMARGRAEEEALGQALLSKMDRDKVGAKGALALLGGFPDDEAKLRETYESLIIALSDSEVSIRELAIKNLEELVGKAPGPSYDPGRPSANEAAIKAWRRLLDENRLPPKERGKL